MKEFKEFDQYEEAYRQMKEQDAPDLWARIEAGIMMQEEKSEECSKSEVQENVSISRIRKASTQKKTWWKSSRMVWISSLSAAVVVLMIGLPVLWYVGIGSMGTLKNSQMAMDQSTNSMMESETQNEDAFWDSFGGNEEKDICYNEVFNGEAESESIAEQEEQGKREPIQLEKVEGLQTEELEVFSLEEFSETIRMSLEKVVEHGTVSTYYVDLENGKIYVEMENTIYYVKGVCLE